jgi:hypothetical protein
MCPSLHGRSRLYVPCSWKLKRLLDCLDNQCTTHSFQYGVLEWACRNWIDISSGCDASRAINTPSVKRHYPSNTSSLFLLGFSSSLFTCSRWKRREASSAHAPLVVVLGLRLAVLPRHCCLHLSPRHHWCPRWTCPHVYWPHQCVSTAGPPRGSRWWICYKYKYIQI